MVEAGAELTLDGIGLRSSRSGILQFFRKLFRRRTALVGFIIITIVVIDAILAPWIAPHDPLATNVSQKFATPSLKHPFGLDNLGRDNLSRIMYAARISLELGVFATGIGAAAGVILGMLSGYFRGMVDAVIMRFMDALMALPGLLLVIGLAAGMGTGLVPLIIAIGVATTPSFARVLRGSVLVTREMDYVQAARAIGAGNARIMAYHIWPNTLQPIIVQATLGVGMGILIGAGASFIGVGVQPPQFDWGQMVNSAHQYIHSVWWLSLPSGLAIFVTVLGFNLLGDGLRDALDPRLRGVG
jgi:peptide/nickel transport system permease protein